MFHWKRWLNFILNVAITDKGDLVPALSYFLPIFAPQTFLRQYIYRHGRVPYSGRTITLYIPVMSLYGTNAQHHFSGMIEFDNNFLSV